jgi:ADP-ribosylglycohydrolase
MDEVQRDRAAGVLLGQACGDALGVPHESALRREFVYGTNLTSRSWHVETIES